MAFEAAEAAGWLIVHDGNSVKLTFTGVRCRAASGAAAMSTL